MTNPKKERRMEILRIVAEGVGGSKMAIHTRLLAAGYVQSYQTTVEDIDALGLVLCWQTPEDLKTST